MLHDFLVSIFDVKPNNARLSGFRMKVQALFFLQKLNPNSGSCCLVVKPRLPPCCMTLPPLSCPPLPCHCLASPGNCQIVDHAARTRECPPSQPKRCLFRKSQALESWLGIYSSILSCKTVEKDWAFPHLWKLGFYAWCTKYLFENLISESVDFPKNFNKL